MEAERLNEDSVEYKLSNRDPKRPLMDAPPLTGDLTDTPSVKTLFKGLFRAKR